METRGAFVYECVLSGPDLLSENLDYGRIVAARRLPVTVQELREGLSGLLSISKGGSSPSCRRLNYARTPVRRLPMVCYCGHVTEEHGAGFFRECNIDDCDCEDFRDEDLA